MKQYRQNRTFQNNEKEFYQQVGWMYEGMPTTGWQGNKTILGKIWERKEHNRKTEWISKIGKELEGIEEGPKARIHLDLLRAILKKRSRKRPAMMAYMDTSLKKFTSIYDRLSK